MSIDYRQELERIRDAYYRSHPSQRLKTIRSRIESPSAGANQLVIAVSSVEALARTLRAWADPQFESNPTGTYSKYRFAKVGELIQGYLGTKGVPDMESAFGQETWEQFGVSVEFRNLLVHECTGLGQDKYCSLISACELVREKLVALAGV